MRFAVVASSALGWGSVRALYERHLPNFGDVRFFHPDQDDPRFGLKSLSVARGFRDACRQAVREGYDRILVTSFTAAMLLPRGPHYVLYGDATFRQLLPKGKSLSWRKGVYEKAVGKLADRGAEFACMSDWARAGVIKDFGARPQNTHVVRNPVDTDLFVPDAEPSRDRLRAVFLGGDFLRKGGDLVLAASERLPEVEFHVVSPQAPDGGQNVVLHRALKPQSRALVETLRSCHIMVLPTRSDCSPNALAEALALGLPVVTTDVGACAEFTFNGRSGWVVEPNVDSLVGQLSDLTLEGCRTKGRVSRELALEEFSVSRHAAKLVSLLAI